MQVTVKVIAQTSTMWECEGSCPGAMYLGVTETKECWTCGGPVRPLVVVRDYYRIALR